MARVRLRIVAGLGRGAPARGFIVGSLAVHLALTVVLVWIPELTRGPRELPSATVVELVGAPPASRAAAAAQAAPPLPEPAPPEPAPEGVTLPKPSPPEPVKKPPEKKKKEEKKPAPKPAAAEPQAKPPADAAPAQPGPAGAGAAAASGVAGSAATGASVSALDLGDAAFAWYRAAVANALYGSWRRPVLSGIVEPLEVRVAFEIMRDGTVRGLRVEEPSGVPVLDRSALRAVADAAPLPALPSTLREPYLPATIVFRLHPEGI